MTFFLQMVFEQSLSMKILDIPRCDFKSIELLISMIAIKLLLVLQLILYFFVFGNLLSDGNQHSTVVESSSIRSASGTVEAANFNDLFSPARDGERMNFGCDY